MTTKQQKPSELKPWMSKYPETLLPDLTQADRSLNDALWLNNTENMYSTALSYGKRNISFKEMKDAILCTARAFVKLGVGAGEVVTVCASAVPEALYIIYALDLIGAIPNLLDPAMGEEKLRFHIKEVKSRVVAAPDTDYSVIQRAVVGTYTGLVIILSKADAMRGFQKTMYRLKNKDQNQYEGNAALWLDFYYFGMDPLCELYLAENLTGRSGILFQSDETESETKTVMLSSQAVNAVAIQYGVDHFAQRERSLNLIQITDVFGFVCGIHAPLCHGASVILQPDGENVDLGAFIVKEKPDHMNGTAAQYMAFCQSAGTQEADLSFLKSTVCIGDMTMDQENQINGFLRSHECPYALAKVLKMAEMAGIALYERGLYTQPGVLGFPLCDTTAGVFEPNTDQELDFDEAGEICFTGSGLMKGYLKQPEATSAVLKQHRDGKIWLHTGINGQVGRDGVFCLAKEKDNVKSVVLFDGKIIDGEKIEKRLSNHANVKYCAVVGVSDPEHEQGERPFAFIKWHDESADARRSALREIRHYCETQLPQEYRPIGFVSVRRFPQIQGGQIDYKELKKQGNVMQQR